MTRFSRAVKWFEVRHGTFADHRALFQSAPVYAVLTGLIIMSIFAVYSLSGNWKVLLGAIVAAAAIVSAMVYMFFMIVGSVEYDADQTHANLEGARAVQESLIPRNERLPMRQHIEWASKFIPEVEVGGDYFDAAETASGELAIADAPPATTAPSWPFALCDRRWAPKAIRRHSGEKRGRHWTFDRTVRAMRDVRDIPRPITRTGNSSAG